MAYRFLLEVPGNLVEDATVAVGEAGDAQVVVVRTSHGLGYDDRQVDLTIAAHSLLVIDALYDWFTSMGESRPDVRLVLHGGERRALGSTDRGGMVAAIRRDQPWVERTLPRIGDHVVESFGAGNAAPRSAVATATSTLQRAGAAPVAGQHDQPVDRRGSIIVRAVNHVAIRVLDLAKAEAFYTEFFGMELVGRSRRGPDGALVPLNGGDHRDDARTVGAEADSATLRNGPLTLALQRVGRGVRLPLDGVLDHVSISVDSATFATIKGEVLMRGFATLAASGPTIAFRDPFGMVWEVTTGRGQ